MPTSTSLTPTPLPHLKAKEQAEDAVKFIEVFIQLTRPVVVVPNLVSLGQLSEAPAAKSEENGGKPVTGATPSILLRWELGTQVCVRVCVWCVWKGNLITC